MLSLLYYLASAEIFYMPLSPDNFSRVARGPTPTIVRFFSAHRKQSLQLDDQYDYVAMMFKGVEGINVAAVNCGKFRTFCYNEGISMPPAVRLYTPEAVHIYDGGMSHESISRWATGLTGVRGKELPYALREPNGRVFKEIINNTHCVFTMFYNPNSGNGKQFIPALKQVAEAFKYDDRVEIVANDVDLYKFFNWDYGLSMFPDMRLWCKDENEPVKYSGGKSAQEILDFINDYCGTQRGLNGRLSVEAGIIDEVSQIVEDFLTKGHRAQYITEMESVEGTKYYVTVMKEIIEKGDSFITEERDRLNRLLNSKALAPDKIDEFQIRVNILGVFAGYLDA